MNTSDLSSPWKVDPGVRVWVAGHDVAARTFVNRSLAGVHRPPTGEIDAAFITPESTDECAYFLAKVQPRLAREAQVWVVGAQGSVTGDGAALKGIVRESGYEVIAMHRVDDYRAWRLRAASE